MDTERLPFNDIASIDVKRLLKHAQIGVVIHALDTTIVYANPAAMNLLRLSFNQLIGKEAADPQWRFVTESLSTIPVEDYPVNRVINEGRMVNETIGVIDSSSKDISWFLVNGYLESMGQQEGFAVITFVDVTESKNLFSFEDIVENAKDLVVVTEAGDIEYPTGPRIVYVNKAFEELTEYTAEEVIGETPRILQGSLTDEATKTRIYEKLKKGESINETILNYTKSGHPYWLELNIIPLTNRFGELTHFAAIERDVSEAKFMVDQIEARNKELVSLKQNLEEKVVKRTEDLERIKSKLEKMAYYDFLTGLLNRRSFDEHSKRLVSIAQRYKKGLLIGILDIDDFKLINDTYGHDIGDEVIKSIAEAMQQCFRDEDVYARLGGEEFVFTTLVADEDQATIVLERLQSAIRSLSVIAKPIVSDPKQTNSKESIPVTVSIGGYYCDSPNTPIKAALQKADQAMYEAKNKGKNRYVLFK